MSNSPDDNIFELDHTDPFESVIIDLVLTNRKKRADYAGGGNPFQNFIDSAYQLNTAPGMSCEQLIATKQARLRNLLGTGTAPQNEPVHDSILDRAVYSIIALAMYRQGLYYTTSECITFMPSESIVSNPNGS